MDKPLTPPKVLFDELFGQLLGWVAKREELKTTKGSSVDLVDVNDHLHPLRSELATARRALTDETGIHMCSRGDAANSESRPADHPPTISTSV